MSSFESTLARMKDLYTYGKELNESSKAPVYTLEYSAKAADGKTYGIIRECNKYYIKSATKGQERIAESYNYLGGFCNKKNYEYTSYNNALKNFELKMASINEACDANVNIATLDPFKKGDFLVEGTEKMRNEIARQRQIMYNASMIMNESTEIGADRKDDVVMYDGKNPEANTGKKGTENMKNAKANPSYAGSKTNGVKKSVAPFDNKPCKCADQLQEGCDCGENSCDCGDDWASKGMGKGHDPKSIGWNIEGQQQVNEEDDWASEGLPSSAGIGVANSNKNNMPFNKAINEEGEEVNDGAMMEDDVDFGMDSDFESDEEMGDDEIDSTELDTELDRENDDEFEDDDDMEDGYEFDSDEDMDIEDDKFDSEDDMDMEDDEFDSEDDMVAESKKRTMNYIVESVVSEILKENELNVFGKHPGYQKKPMELPSTGSDKNQWGEDWNDDSVYSEQPFGTQKGNSAPFEKLVDAVTKTVMTKIEEESRRGKKKVK